MAQLSAIAASICFSGPEVSVHIVASYPPAGTIPELAERVRERARLSAPSRPVHVVVEDIVSEGGSG